MVVELNSYICNKKIGSKAKSLIDLYRYGYKVPRCVALDIDEFNDALINIKYKIDALISNLNEDNILTISKEINILMSNIKLNKNVLFSLSKFINSNGKYLIRCSVESNTNYTFAGLFPVIMDVTEDLLEEKILSCYKALYSYNCLYYMLKNNIDITNVSMCIIIQNKIDLEVYATVSTLNPFNINTSELGITIIKNNEKALYKYDYMKNSFIQSDKSNLISKDKIKEIIKLSKSIISNFGLPVMIDLAINNNDIYVLHVREITKLEYDNIEYNWKAIKLSSKMLNYSIFADCIDNSLKKINKQYDIKCHMPFIQTLFNKVYINQYYIKYMLNHIVDFNIYKDIRLDIDFRFKLKRIMNFHKVKRQIKKVNNNFDYNNNYNLFVKNMKKLVPSNIEKDWCEVLDDYHKLINSYIENKIYLSVYENYIMKKWNINSNLLNYIKVHDDNLISVKRNNLFNNLVNKIKENDEAYKYWYSTSTMVLLDNYKNKEDKYYIGEFREYIRKYGYLAFIEMDLSSDYYVEDVEEVIRLVKKSLGFYGKEKVMDMTFLNNKKILKNISVLKEINGIVDSLHESILKYNFVIKRYTKALGNYYVSKKICDNATDIWYMELKDIYSFIDGEISYKDIKEKICNNKLYYKAFINFESKELIGKKHNHINKPSFVGIGISNGLIKGKVNYLKRIDDLKQLDQLEIFVTKNISINLLCQLKNVKGIILSTEYLSSSLCTIIREFNIPCILLPDCSKKLKNDMIVEIDGREGTIKIAK